MTPSQLKWRRVRYQPSTPLGPDGRRATSSPAHNALSRAAGAEGMVLLKNDDHLLPLRGGAKVALFGKGTADYVKGGGGSGDVTVAFVHNLCDGMEEKEAGHRLTVYKPLCDFYRREVQKQYDEGTQPGYTVEPELPDELVREARANCDVAIISICRFSSEGWDRKGEPDDGDFYLSLAEQAMVKKVTDAFDRTVVVLNVGGMVDSSWFKNNPKIGAVLLGWQAGMEGGCAEADVLCGDVCPSGRLTDTFAASFGDYPSSAGFNDSDDYVEYTDDIFVGYRYFETIPGAKNKVNYCFGYGLSYTTFDVVCSDATEKDGQVILTVNVTNTGKVPGKEVVQAYFSAPRTQLDKPAVELAAFAKTEELRPGESRSLTLTFPVEQMASFDDTGVVCRSAYVLEKGKYSVFVGTSVEDKRLAMQIDVVNEDTVVKQLTSLCAPKQLHRRLRSDGTYEELTTSEYTPAAEHPAWPIVERQWAQEHTQPDTHGVRIPQGRVKLGDVVDGKATLDEFLDGMTTEDMMVQLGGQPNTGVANTWGFGGNDAYGIPSAMTSDGPAGVRLRPETGVVCTAWPCATLLACTWNEELVARVGAAGGLELKENNMAVWLTPALNIHRSPLCGRNFEYYSEDPLVAGKTAAALVRGIQSQNVGACAKHFCCNNKENNRLKSDSRVSERALREIYLRGFEITVKESHPWAIMTSYNKMNGSYTSENKELITGILRGEWGFDGMVTTDWNNLAEHYREILAGNDIRMPLGAERRVLKALEEGLLTREDLRPCVKRIMEMLLKLD